MRSSTSTLTTWGPPKKGNNVLWRKLLRPEFLFLLGTLQALLPYLIFAIAGNPAPTLFELSYYPMAISIIGYFCFWAGVKFGPQDVPQEMESRVPVSLSLLKGGLVLTSIVTVGEIIGLIGVYGGIPLLGFLSGAIDVNDTNQAEASSGFGQVGASSLTVYMLMGLICLLAIKAKQEGTRVAGWLAGSTILVICLAAFNGKRQGLLMCIGIVVCCSTLVFGNPFELISSFIPTVIHPKTSSIIGILILLGAIKGLGTLATVRNSDISVTTTDELTLYYEWPVMNMSLQAIEAGGFGPYELRPLGPLKTLLPAKSTLDPALFGSDVPRFERSSPSGFYERLQWTTGLWGIIPFTFLCGLFCQHMYKMAFKGYAPLLSYSLIAWALFSAALYNHFLNLLFLPLPTILFAVAAYFHRQLKRGLY